MLGGRTHGEISILAIFDVEMNLPLGEILYTEKGIADSHVLVHT